MVAKIKYALDGVKLNVKMSYFHKEGPHRDVCATYHLHNGENAAAGLPSHDVDKLKQSLIDVWHGFEQCHNMRNFEHLI